MVITGILKILRNIPWMIYISREILPRNVVALYLIRTNCKKPRHRGIKKSTEIIFITDCVIPELYQFPMMRVIEKKMKLIIRLNCHFDNKRSKNSFLLDHKTPKAIPDVEFV